MRGRPALIDRPDITQQAVAAALHAGLERGTPDFHTAVENNFNTLMGRVEAQATPAATPAFFQPPPSPAPAQASPSAMYSAPPSRSAPGGGYREPSPSQVRLSPEEMQIAAASGISDTEYARYKLRLAREKRDGTRQ
jgi:hypothetical protein